MESYKTIKKIDIHSHALPAMYANYFPPVYRGGCPLITDEQVIDFYDKIGTEKGVLLPCSAAEGQMSVFPSEVIKHMTVMHPDRFLWFCNVDPRARDNTPDSDLYEILAFYKSIGAKGVGEITANIYTDDPRMENLFAACEALDMPVTIHMNSEFKSYGMVDEAGLPRLEKMLKKFPKLKVLGHSQCFWCEMSADCSEEERCDYPTGKVTEGRIAKLLRKYDNLYCDISAGSGSNAFMRDREYAAKFINEFSDRILYGSDICLAHQTFPFAFDEFLKDMVEKGEISEENYCKIVRYNAEKLLNL